MSDIWAFATTYFLTLFLSGIIFLTAMFLLFQNKKSHWIIYFLLAWFPLESVFLRYTPPDYYALVKYLPEALLYFSLLFSSVKYLFRSGKKSLRNPLNAWLVGFVVIAFVSWILNRHEAFVWLAGMRQLLRFVAIFFFVLFENYEKNILKRIFAVICAIVIAEAGLAIIQHLAGGKLDNYLFFSQEISFGWNVRSEAIEQFWAKGQRVFATLGRYDRLGSFLAIGLLMIFPWLYSIKKHTEKSLILLLVLVIGLAVVLTYSRASWIAVVVGLFVVGYNVLRDKRVLRVGVIGLIGVASLLVLIVAVRGFGSGAVDQARQNVLERTLEAVSFYSWEQSYEGYGRIFFIINTPLVVARNYPFFGAGPGNYGSGAAAALQNDKMYNHLGLPFGIQNIHGQIDNNWMSILGETGLFGLACWLGIFYVLFKSSVYVFEKSNDKFVSNFGAGFAGVCVAMAIVGFFGPYFEFRASMFYFWLLAGIMILFWKSVKQY